MQKPALIIAIQIFVIILLSVVRISVSNRISTSGIAIAGMEDQVASLKKDNLILQEKLLTISSFTQIASKAAEIGFVPNKANFVISRSISVARFDARQAIKQ